MPKLVSLALLVIIVLAGTAYAEPFDLKGDRLGMKLEDWEQRHGKEPGCFDEDNLVWPEIFRNVLTYNSKTTVAREKVCVTYHFTKTSEDSGYFLYLIDILPIERAANAFFGFIAKSALETKYGPPDRLRVPDPDDLDEVTRYNVPAHSWVRDDSEILLVYSEEHNVVDFKLVHWHLWRKHRFFQNSRIADDL